MDARSALAVRVVHAHFGPLCARMARALVHGAASLAHLRAALAPTAPAAVAEALLALCTHNLVLAEAVHIKGGADTATATRVETRYQLVVAHVIERLLLPHCVHIVEMHHDSAVRISSFIY